MLKWYPPAETKIPISHLFFAVFPAADGFGKELKSYLGAEHCVLGNSARTLLYMLLTKLREEDNRGRNEILIPGYTCYSLAASIVKAKLKIKVYDLDPNNFYPDVDSVKANIGPKTLAIISQHLFGIPTRVDDIVKLSSEAGLTHIEDAAQGLGASISGKRLGLWGDFGLFSFGRGKPLPLGCGGALVSSVNTGIEGFDAGVRSSGYKRLALTACVQILSYPNLYGFLEALPLGLGDTIFDPSFKVSSMPDTINRLGAISIGSLERLNEHRRMIAQIYKDKLTGDLSIPVLEESEPIFTRYPVMIPRKCITRSLLQLGARRMYPNAIADVPAILPYLASQGNRTPGAASIAERLVTLPTHTGISLKTAGHIAQKVIEC